MKGFQFLFSFLIFVLLRFADAELKASDETKAANTATLTIVSPASGTFYPYQLVPFNVTASDGSFPIVTITLSNDPTAIVSGNCSSLIYLRMPDDMSGSLFYVTASSTGYSPADSESYSINGYPFLHNYSQVLRQCHFRKIQQIRSILLTISFIIEEALSE